MSSCTVPLSRECAESSGKGFHGQWAACETSRRQGMAVRSFDPRGSDVKFLFLPEQQGLPLPHAVHRGERGEMQRRAAWDGAARIPLAVCPCGAAWDAAARVPLAVCPCLPLSGSRSQSAVPSVRPT